MTQEIAERWTSPTASVARRMKELRMRRGWSAVALAEQCERAGMPELNRSVIANIESGRRTYVSVDEAFCLAYVLDVAPIHLMVPTDEDPAVGVERFRAAPDRFLPIPVAREWVRGRHCPPGCDPRTYFAEVPREEWEPPTPTREQMTERGEDLADHRRLVERVLPIKKGKHGKR